MQTNPDLRTMSSGGEYNLGRISDRLAQVTPEHDESRWQEFQDGSSSASCDGASRAGACARRAYSMPELGISRSRSLANGRLLDEYTLGNMLGQGSFGIVFACTRKVALPGTPGDLAVKLVDKVESLPEDIAREVRTHQSLSHPNILKVHEIIDEKCFLCIVTDRFSGGDLVRVLKSHASAGKRIRTGKIVHIVRQMLHAIAYLHQWSIVHRDIKADNYLLDRVSLMDSKCHVVLADFGYACECKVGDRLSRRCGTRAYWPPELWDRSYTRKVDLWAMGVTLYGIVEGCFPFQSEWDVKHKDVSCHPFVSARCCDLIQQLLSKLEVQRPSADEALCHLWLMGQISDTAADVDIEWRPGVDAIKADGPDPGVAARRLELVERLEGVSKTRRMMCSERSEGSGHGSHRRSLQRPMASPRGGVSKLGTLNSDSSLDSAHETPAAVLSGNSFHVVDRLADKVRTFEWWPRHLVPNCSLQNASEENLPGRSPWAANPDVRRYSNTRVIGQLLETHGINTALFGQGFAKSLERFADELESGASQLMTDAAKHKALVRVVDVVLLRLVQRTEKGVHYLIVSADEQLDGRLRSDLNRLPGTKKKPHENVRKAAERIVMEMPDVDVEDVAFNFEATEVFEEEEESPSYPGVRTVYRKQIVEGLSEQKDRRGTRIGRSGLESMSHKSSRSTKFFSWLSVEECSNKRVRLWAPQEGAEISSLVPAPIGLKVKALGRYLKANKIDPSAFGRDRAKTLQELSTELVTGESSLMTLPDGTVIRLVDVVLLMVTKSGTDLVLVVAKESSASAAGVGAELNRLPGTKRRPDENHFHAAKRVLKRQLKVNENRINLNAEDVQICEEEKDSPSYPGLRTVYCKRIIAATLEIAPLTANSRSTVSVSVGTEPRPHNCASVVRNHTMDGR